jgi:paraquat-inducible protein A
MSIIACYQCDLVHRIPPLPEWTTARCSRCGALLLRTKSNSIDQTLALLVAGLILFSLACSFPFLALRSGSSIQETALVTGVKNLYLQGMPGLASLVLLTCVLIPLVQMLSLLYVLAPLKFNHCAPFAARVFRWHRNLQPWGMMEIFMLGILVALVKLGSLATIIPGIALIAFAVLIFVMAAMLSVLEPNLIWEKLGESR